MNLLLNFQAFLYNKKVFTENNFIKIYKIRKISQDNISRDIFIQRE